MRIKCILVTALLVRLLFITISNDEFNLWTFTAFADLALKGYNPWLASFHLGFRAATESTPLMVLLLTGVQLSEKIFLLPSYIGFKAIMILSDILSTYFFYKIAFMLSNERRLSERLTLLFGLNPLLIFVSTITIIDDSIVILFTILALYFFLKHSYSKPELPETLLLSAFFLGLGISIKFYPIFLIPAFLVKLLKLKDMLIFIFLSSLPFLVFSLPFVLWDFTSYYLSFIRYVAAPPTIVKIITVEVRQPMSGFSLWWVILDLMETKTPESVWLLNLMAIVSVGTVFVILAYFMRKKNSSIILNLNLSLLVVYLFYFRMSAHYIAWILPFAYLLGANSLKRKPNVKLIISTMSVIILTYYLIVAGQYGSTGGRQLYSHGGGIFYFFYPILRSDVLTWTILDLSWLSILRIATFLILAINLYLLVKLLYAIKNGSNKKMFDFWRIRRVWEGLRRHLVVISLVFLILTLSINLNVYAASDSKNSSSVFFDDFDTESLSFDWYWTGEGTYSMYPRGNPSHILLDTQGVEKRSFIYQFVYYLIPPKVYGVQGSIALRFQTVEFAENASTLFLFNLDHGWLSAEKVFRETSPKILLDRYLYSSWTPVAFGFGGLGISKIEFDSYDAEKATAVKVGISNGTFLQSGIMRSYDMPQDWTEYSYLFMDVYGEKTGAITWLYIQSPDAANARSYSFIDTWIGWRTIVFPLNHTQPADTGKPDLSKVRKILVLWQTAGDRYINCIGIDKELNYNLRYDYVDTMASKKNLLQEYDFMERDLSWHTFKVTCNSTGRRVYFDGVPKVSIDTFEEKTFSYLILGNFDQDPSKGGSIAIDWVEIGIDSLKQDHIRLWLALGLPTTGVVLIGVALYLRVKKKKQSNAMNLSECSMTL